MYILKKLSASGTSLTLSRNFEYFSLSLNIPIKYTPIKRVYSLSSNSFSAVSSLSEIKMESNVFG